MEPASPDCLTPSLIDGLLADGLTREARRRAEEHLAACPACRAEVEEHRQFEEICLGFEALDVLPERPSLPGYTVERWLGRGGCGAVWLARHNELPRPRALKVLRPDRYTPAALAALVEEGRALDRLGKHVNRVTVHELVSRPDGVVLVMEYVDGGPLHRLGPLPWERAVRYVIDAAEGLKDVHAAGMVHGDIKPQNLLWDRGNDRGVLCDFGVARHADGAVRGWTPGYAAPEVVGGRGGFGGDVFGVAATLYGLLVGDAPCDARGAIPGPEALRHSLGDVPAGVQDVVLAGLEPEPGRRPGLAEFQERLRRVHLFELAEELGRRVKRSTSPVRLEVALSAARSAGQEFRPLAHCATREDAPERVVEVTTGELVRIEARANVAGYLTVLNFGGHGDLDVLLPTDQFPHHAIEPGRPQGVIVRMAPPAGTDRAAIIWTRRCDPAGPREWCRRLGEGRLGTRDRKMETVMPTVGQAGEETPDEDWTAVVVTVVQQSV
jgi:serine/threonine-protein kinase